MAGVVGAGLAIYQAEMKELRDGIRKTRDENGKMMRDVKSQNIEIKELQNQNAYLAHTLAELEKEHIRLLAIKKERGKVLGRSNSNVEQTLEEFEMKNEQNTVKNRNSSVEVDGGVSAVRKYVRRDRELRRSITSTTDILEAAKRIDLKSKQEKIIPSPESSNSKALSNTLQSSVKIVKIKDEF